MIPEKTSLVMVHGEVLFPNAVTWQDGWMWMITSKNVAG
jgi:hypothetical protein